MNTDWITSLAGWAFDVSLSSIIPVLLVLLLAYARLLPARWSVWLGAVVLIRLMMPMVPNVTWNPLVLPVAEASKATATEISAAQTPMVAGNLFDGISKDSSTEPATARSIDWTLWLSAVWAVGAVVVLGWIARSHLIVRRWVREGIAPDARLVALWQECRVQAGCTLAVPLVLVPRITTLAVNGVFRPRVLAPLSFSARYSDEEIRSMFLHEMAHIRRHDVLWTWLGLLACALHWFNPLAWLTLRRFSDDRELLCDDFALRHMGRPDRKCYGGALIKMLSSEPPVAPATLAPFFRNHTELKHRIHTIMKPTRITTWSRVLALTVVPALAALTLTTAQADGEKEKDKPAAPKEGESEVRKAVTKDGERETEKPRDGERKKEGPRDGEARKEGPRDGEAVRAGPRDGEVKKEGARDGEVKKEGPRDGDKPRKEGEREGDKPRKEGEREGGDKPMKKEGEREGDFKKPMKKEGDEGAFKKPFNKEGGDAAMKKPGTDKAAPAGGIVVTLDAEGNVVSSDGWKVPADTVREKLQALAAKNPDQSVSIRSAPGTPLAKVIETMKIMEEAGIKNVNLGSAK